MMNSIHHVNRKVADMFREAGVIEKYGDGIKRIINTIKKDGLKEPIFESYQHGFRVSVSSSQVDKVTDNQKVILKAVADDHTITTAELAKVVGISQRKIKENLNKLKDLGLIERIGKARGGYWKLKQPKK